ncbi:MAG: metal-dependent hydrolase [Promethearchaeia archaeon]
MFPIFHIAIPLAIFEVPYIKQNYKFNRFALISGALFPDIIDKSLLILRLSSGRGISHTLLFISLISVLMFILSKKNTALSVPFFSGNLIHLILDLPYVPLLYPFVQYNFSMMENPIEGWLYSLLHNPLVYGTEIAGIGILFFIMVSNKLYSSEDIVAYLGTNKIDLEPSREKDN